MNATDDVQQYIITEDDLFLKRLDKILAQRFPQLSRTQIQQLFSLGHIELDNAPLASLSKIPPLGSKILLTIPLPQDYNLEPENIPLNILFEDDDIVFINKPAGMCVHPAAGNWHHTLVHALLYHCPNLKGIGHEKRPGIVHRLDKGTSGIMVVAKSQRAHQGLVELFKTHDILRQYELLILNKKIPSGGVITSLIDRSPTNRKKMTSNTSQGKQAITKYKVLLTGKLLTLVECTLETGRTHQIRVHMAEKMKCPLLNDFLYGNPKQQIMTLPEEATSHLLNYPHPMLHAKKLGLKHPLTGQWLEFTQEPPSPFKDLVELLRTSAL